MPRDMYVIHAMQVSARNRGQGDIEIRNEYHDYRKAFRMWKTYAIGGYRVGMFYWSKDGTCSKLYATSDYNLRKDHG
jgi:hypothetical protein